MVRRPRVGDAEQVDLVCHAFLAVSARAGAGPPEPVASGEASRGPAKKGT